MRLVCPNCSAQYEIDGSMIPDEGRDVQCSNCGHTWFELPPPPSDLEELTAQDFAAQDDLAAGFDDDGADAEPEVEEHTGYDGPDEDPDEIDDGRPGRVSDIVSEAASADGDDDADDDGDMPMPGAAPKQRRPADTAALDVLREEAEREMSQRRAPPSENIETQTDLGLDEIRDRSSPSRALRARMAHLGEEEALETVEQEPTRREPTAPPERVDEPDRQDDSDYAEPRRDLLPDIDEINSTLKSTHRRETEGQTGRGGFLSGFLLMLVIAAGLIVAYAQAPAIARAMPGSESFLISYVDSANAFRDWLAGLIDG